MSLRPRKRVFGALDRWELLVARLAPNSWLRDVLMAAFLLSLLGSIGIRGDHAGADGIERGLRAALHPQFREDAAHVRLDGLLRIVQVMGDLLVGLPPGQQLQHLGLAWGECFGTLPGTDRLHQARRRFGRQLYL